MRRLLAAFCTEAAARGRSSVLVPLALVPELGGRLSGSIERTETRYLHWSDQRLPLPRPFADLVYWYVSGVRRQASGSKS